LLWAGGFTGSDGRSYKESVADAHEAIRTAAELKADCLVVYSGSRGGHTQNHAKRLLCSALRELLPIACEFGITMAIEPMPAACATEWTFLTDLDSTLALFDELDSAALKLVFDTYHFGHDELIVERLPALASRIAIVQLADATEAPHVDQNRCRLGLGAIPLDEIIARLTHAGYEGYFDVKLMGEEIETCDYAEILAHSKKAFESLSAACVS
jgi:sugar phosphate isomerase/epimerase